MIQPLPRVPPFDRPATYENLVALPDLYVAEIVGGELCATRPLPPLPNVARMGLGAILGWACHLGRNGPGGWWVLKLIQLRFGPDVVVPDIAGWRKTRMPRRPDTAYLSLAPDWVCEVL